VHASLQIEYYKQVDYYRSSQALRFAKAQNLSQLHPDVGEQKLTCQEPEEGDGTSLIDAEQNTFCHYTPSCSSSCLKNHPDALVESSSLTGTPMPTLSAWNRLRLPSKTFLRGHLTTAQLEGVLRACAQHDLFLDDGCRKGFFLGDGAGVGKGRQQAGIIFHNFNHSRRKSLWFSASADLIEDARKDLQDIGAGIIDCHDLRNYKAEQDLTKIRALDQGILFCTYSLLVSGKSPAKSRVEQILRYLGKNFDGVVSFDEMHCAKNLGQEGPANEKQGSETAKRVNYLQEKLPFCRVLYVSATGATEIEHMACFSRLGLWGPKTPFSNR
jgi:hypothetical protein